MIVQMARFNVGDLVRREMSPSADYVSLGTIMVVVPNHHHLEIFDEYEVHFGANGIIVTYDNQLKPATQQRDNRPSHATSAGRGRVRGRVGHYSGDASLPCSDSVSVAMKAARAAQTTFNADSRP